MLILAHLTKEASQAIFFGMIMLVLAAIVVLALIVWGIVALFRSERSKNRGPDSNQKPKGRE